MASLSRREPGGQIIATGNWTWRGLLLKDAEQHLRRALNGVGNPDLERLFRMNITLCLHRALSEAEVAGLPPSWEAAPGGLAGGPLQLLRQKGIPDDLQAAKPCHTPGREEIIPGRPDLWLPVDCGACPPCIARASIERDVETRKGLLARI